MYFLSHRLSAEINNDLADCTFSSFNFAHTHIRIERNLRSICGIVTIRETHHQRWRGSARLRKLNCGRVNFTCLTIEGCGRGYTILTIHRTQCGSECMCSKASSNPFLNRRVAAVELTSLLSSNLARRRMSSSLNIIRSMTQELRSLREFLYRRYTWNNIHHANCHKTQ